MSIESYILRHLPHFCSFRPPFRSPDCFEWCVSAYSLCDNIYGLKLGLSMHCLTKLLIFELIQLLSYIEFNRLSKYRNLIKFENFAGHGSFVTAQ